MALNTLNACKVFSVEWWLLEYLLFIFLLSSSKRKYESLAIIYVINQWSSLYVLQYSFGDGKIYSSWITICGHQCGDLPVIVLSDAVMVEYN